MQDAELDEAQAGIKISGRNIKNLRYAEDTTLMAESEEALKSLLMKVKEECEIVGLELNIQKTKTMTSSHIISWQIDRETMETVTDFIWGGSKVTADGDCSNEMKRRLLLGRKVMTNVDTEDIVWKSQTTIISFLLCVLHHVDISCHMVTLICGVYRKCLILEENWWTKSKLPISKSFLFHLLSHEIYVKNINTANYLGQWNSSDWCGLKKL